MYKMREVDQIGIFELRSMALEVSRNSGASKALVVKRAGVW